jgi:hypothetical protein
LFDRPFDVSQNSFKSALTLWNDAHTANAGDLYVGTSGVSGMVDLGGALHVAYWTSGNRIKHCAYTYSAAANSLSACSPTTVDSAGSANHPAVAVSPADNSLTVAWMSEAGANYKILARTRTAGGTWGAQETVTPQSVTAWHSTSFGLNVDQGPSLIISPDGTKHLVYIQHVDASTDYGRIHYAVNSGAGWQDTALANYTHDPALTRNAAGDLYIFGHGHPRSGSVGTSACLSMLNMCYMRKPAGGSWGSSQLLIAASGNQSFDGSPSVKWSAVGFNRPDAVEAAFFSIINGNYYQPTVHYARLP